MKQYTHDDLCDMSHEEVKELFNAHFPKADKEVKQAVYKLNSLMIKVKKVFPDANYYLAMEGLNLMVGNDTTAGKDSFQNLSAVHYDIKGSGGGDW